MRTNYGALNHTAKTGRLSGWSVFEANDGKWHWTAHAGGVYGGGTAPTEGAAQTAARSAYDGLQGRWA